MRIVKNDRAGLPILFLSLILLLVSVSRAVMAAPGIIAPTEGSALSGTSQTFSWTADGADINRWWLYVGTSAGASDILNSGNLGTRTQLDVTDIPANGGEVHVRLWFNNGVRWSLIDTVYTAAVQGGTENPDSSKVIVSLPALVTPDIGSVLAGGSIQFEWQDNNTPVNYWWMYIGSRQGGSDLYNSGPSLRNENTVTVDQLPTDGSTVYVRLWHRTTGNRWRFTDSVYSTGGTETGGSDADGSETVAGDAFESEDETNIEAAVAANLALIKNNATRNTQFDDNPYRDVPASDISVSDLTVNADIYNEGLLDTSNSGYFRVKCEVSHFAYDDPIVFPNRPGRAHLHMFFGNTNANAYSTFDSLLNSGTGTCNGEDLNRTAYWVPALLDGQGNALIPDQIMVYYKNDNFRLDGANELVSPFPDNLRMIAGNGAATSAQTGFTGDWEVQPVISFSCGPAYRAESRQALIPDCYGSENQLEMQISFPQCVNEAAGTYRSDQSHMSYSENGYYGVRCPDSHPTDISSIMYRIFFRTDEYGGALTDLHLSSDVKMDQILPGGTTAHADWFGAWHPDAMDLWVENCNNTQADCETGLLGRNPAISLVLRKQNFYDYGYKAPARELIKLCPGKEYDPQNPLRSVAMCRMN